MKPDQLSNTAAFIAIKFYGLMRDEPYRSLFDEEVIQFYERLVQHMPAPIRYYHPALKYNTLRRFFTFWEELLLPGDLMHIILRKWYLTRWVDDIRKQGYNQLLVPGAGFDHLGVLFADKGMHCREIDTSKMIQLKKYFLKEHEYNHSKLALTEAFLSRDSMLKILSKSNLDPSLKTVIVAEGFFDYFAQQQCSVMLNDLNQFFNNDIRLLSTLFSLDELSRFRAFVYRNSIRLAGEELKLGFARNDFIAFLKDHGFNISENVNRSEMRQEVLIPHNISHPILKGFYLINAERKAKNK